jgi:amino acid adenylation domain-containing protein
MAAKQPSHIALCFGDEQISYQELNSRANQIAHFLSAQSVSNNNVVGVYMDRDPELIVSLLGILKAGAAYLPIDPSFPPDRVAFLLQDAGVSLLLTQSTCLSDLKEIECTTVCIDDFSSNLSNQPTENLSTLSSVDDLAYIIYTSGSTGRPKGVKIPHKNVVRLFKATQDWFQFDQTDVWTFFHSHAFDFSVWEIWGSLIYGGRLVIVSYETSRSLIEFKKLLTDEKVTILNQTPTAFNHLINDGSTEISFDPQFLKYIIFGGEALRMQSLEPWIERYGDQHPRLINMYGITETTVHVTYRPITKSDFALGSMIGTPIPDMGVYILEPNLEPAPIGIPGEMFIGGEGLADGYLNRQELTTERFINNPFLPETKGQLYRTGDLARRLESGDIEYLGRIDRQVQLRGFRIEMGEIESCLSEHPHIEESALLMSEGQPGDQHGYSFGCSALVYHGAFHHDLRRGFDHPSDPGFRRT